MKKQIIYYCIIALGVLSVGWCFYSQKINTAITSEKNKVVVPQTKTSIEKTSATTTQKQSGVIDEHLTINNELRDVNFCGKIYQVKQVLIDGVDVAQRVAELATKDLIPKTIGDGKRAEAICLNVQQNSSHGVITISKTKIFNGSESPDLPHEEIYQIKVGGQTYDFSALSHDIYMVGGYDGTIVGPIGKLK